MLGLMQLWFLVSFFRAACRVIVQLACPHNHHRHPNRTARFEQTHVKYSDASMGADHGDEQSVDGRCRIILHLESTKELVHSQENLRHRMGQ